MLLSSRAREGRAGADGVDLMAPARARARAGAAQTIKGNKATADQSPLLELESHSKGHLRVGNWVVQGLYIYAVKETVKLWCPFSM